VCDASLTAGYIGARPSTLAALSPNADAAALAVECKRLEAEARRLHIAAREASTSPILREMLTDEQWAAHAAADKAQNAFIHAESAWFVAELQRHFPGLAPAIKAVWDHVGESALEPGTCCTPEVE
jgi:hypothetical protein